MFVAYDCDAMLLTAHAYACACTTYSGYLLHAWQYLHSNITKCLSRHVHSISTTLQWYILQHDCGVYNRYIDGTVNHNPMGQFEKNCLSHIHSVLHHRKFL